MPLVLDNSVVTGWWTLSQRTDYTAAALEAARQTPPHAPALLVLEFANVLRRARQHGNIDDAQMHAVLNAIAALKIVVEAPCTDPGRIVSLSLQYGLTAYDAAYLELALRLNLPIACKDGALAKAADASGVGVFRP
jgi:predicted nucleic acid-binding protein